MNLADLSIRRPIFITCVVLLMLAVGWLSLTKLPVDLFPDVTFPVVTVTTAYPGAGPQEIETLVSKPLEDEMSTLSGIKRLSSVNREGMSRVIAEFTLETDVKYAEQQIRDRVSGAKHLLPLDVKEPVIRRIDPADQPIVILSVTGDLAEGKLFDMADDVIRPKLEQVPQVGLVEVIGGRKREIHVALDRTKLKEREISAGGVVSKLAAAGENTPVGKVNEGKRETVFRAMGEFHSLAEIKGSIINFFGSDVPTTVGDVGTVIDTLEDENSRAYVNGEKSLFLYAFRQSGSNTIAVVDALRKQVGKINEEMQSYEGKPHLTVIRDASVWIHANVEDVKESILIGIALAVLVVFFFLGSGRSTIITGLALPNSLLGAFVLMAIAGFSVNIMSLLALSLSVGLLIDDAIVVRENIFRHIEMGKPPEQAARDGTAEVRLAVIATTLTVIAIFGPVAFLKGVVGQFFKQFGATICFAMAISLFDALTIAPMLSAYFAGAAHVPGKDTLWGKTVGVPLRAFDRFQTWLENRYAGLLGWVLKHPFKTLALALVLSVGACSTAAKVPKTFLPPQDAGEFAVGLDLPPGTNIDAMQETASKVDSIIRANKEVDISAMTVGSRDGEPNYADFYVKLIPAKERPGVNTSQLKERLREQLKPFAYANPAVKDYDAVGGGQRPFNLVIVGMDEAELEKYGDLVFQKLRADKRLKDVDTSFRKGKPELQFQVDDLRAQQLGITTKGIGSELRTQVEGLTAAKMREHGREYDIRVRLKDDQRNLHESFAQTWVPNVNNQLVRLTDVAKPVSVEGPANISRMDRGRTITISADIAPGAGMGDVMADIRKGFEGEYKMPPGMRYTFIGQAENMEELGSSMATAMGLGVLFIFLVLASLYESFVTPFTIMLALPLALCGGFVALRISGESLNIFSNIGMIMLLGVATKNSILLVDFAAQQIRDHGMSRAEAVIAAGKSRLRPILMTTMALIAGTVPIALGLNEASRQRTSMGVAIVGGLISSTLLTLVVVPAAFSYIDRFRVWSAGLMKRLFVPRAPGAHAPALSGGSAPVVTASPRKED